MEKQAVYGSESIRTANYLNYTTLHLNGLYGNPQRIVAAFYKDGEKEMEGGTESEFLCQFAFCSPKEKSSHKARGRYVATKRLLSDGSRGAVRFTMPEGFTGKMLRDALKERAVKVAKKKNIHWMREYNAADLV